MRYFLTWWSWLYILATIICLLIIAIILPLIKAPKKRWAGIMSGIAFFGLLIVLYGLVEPYQIIVRRETIDLGVARPFTIAVISDLQVSPLKRASFVRRVVDTVLAEQPDAVLYPGDFVNNEVPLADELPHLKPLARLAATIPMIGVHGNHEYGVSDPDLPALHPDVHEEVAEALREQGLFFLQNELLTVTNRAGTQLFEVFGFDDLWSKQFAQPTLPPKENLPRIALAHNPDAVYMVDKTTADMVVSAHTHGGQIRLPGIGAFMSVSTRLPLKFYKGFSVQNDIPLYITSGLGESGPPVRLFNLPEVIILNIK